MTSVRLHAAVVVAHLEAVAALVAAASEVEADLGAQESETLIQAAALVAPEIVIPIQVEDSVLPETVTHRAQVAVLRVARMTLTPMEAKEVETSMPKVLEVLASPNERVELTQVEISRLVDPEMVLRW